MVAILFCFANLRIEISTITLPLFTCQITFTMKCLKPMAKVLKMAAILFCCQFEDQDPKITLGKQVFRIQHHQIALNHRSNYFYHKIPQTKGKNLEKWRAFCFVANLPITLKHLSNNF